MDQKYFERTFKNERLREIVRKAIMSGQWKPGDILPSQNEMCRMYGVSNHTVREAIGSLVHEGLLYRIQGKGTYVAERKLEKLTIGVVTTRLHRDLGTHYRLGYDTIPIIVQYLEEEAHTHGASIILSLTHDDVEAERRVLTDLLERGVDGIVLYYSGKQRNLDCLEKIKQAGIPIVLIDRYAEGVETDYVVTDNRGGAYHAVKHLLDAGFRKIYHLTIQTNTSSIRDRVEGYKQALQDYGVDFDPSWLVPVCTDAFPNTALGVDFHEAHRITQESLDLSGKFAVFAATSTILAGAWRAIAEAHIEHERVALACFDVPIQSIPQDVQFIKVVQPLERIARKSIQLIIDKLSGSSAIQKVVLEPEYRIEAPSGSLRAASSISKED